MIFIYIFIFAVIITITNEIIARQGNWIYKKFGFFILNIILLSGLLTIFAGLTGSVLFSFVFIYVLFFALVNVSFLKYAARNEVLYASDFLLFFKVMTVSDKSNFFTTKYNVFSLLLGLLFLTPAVFLPFFGLSTLQRVILSGAGIIFLLFIFIYIKNSKQEDFTYFTKGFALGLMSNIFLYFTENLSEDKKPDVQIEFVYKPESELKIKPNVIMVLSESFWDIEKIPGFQFSQKVIPTFKSLTESCIHGSLVVTPFGGGTCNVESEILTGAPIRYFNLSNSFYHRYINHPILSLPAIFSENGYDTVALHTFDKNFYNRDVALSHMGINKFLAKEDLADPFYEGLYIADKELTKMIINEYEKKQNPVFILGISMENHQPYSRSKFLNNPIRLENDNLNQHFKSMAETYAHGISDADRELSVLIKYFENVKEPTDIIFFGDHLGALGPMFELYKKFGFISMQKNLTLTDIKNIYSTEFVIWSNYKNEKNYFSDTSSNFLGNIILNYLGFKKPEFYYFMDEVYEKLHCINRSDLFIDSSGKMYSALPDEFLSMDMQYRHLARKLILK